MALIFRRISLIYLFCLGLHLFRSLLGRLSQLTRSYQIVVIAINCRKIRRCQDINAGRVWKHRAQYKVKSVDLFRIENNNNKWIIRGEMDGVTLPFWCNSSWIDHSQTLGSPARSQTPVNRSTPNGLQSFSPDFRRRSCRRPSRPHSTEWIGTLDETRWTAQRFRSH